MHPVQESLSVQFQKLQQNTAKATNEEEIRLSWVRALEKALAITFDAERQILEALPAVKAKAK